MATLWCARILAHLMKVRTRRGYQALVHGANMVVGVEESKVATPLDERDVVALTHQLESDSVHSLFRASGMIRHGVFQG